MKKLLIVVLSISLLFTVCGCKKENKNDISSKSNVVSSENSLKSKSEDENNSSVEKQNNVSSNPNNSSAEERKGTITPTYPINVTVDFHSPEQQLYAKSDIASINSIASGTKELSRPEPIKFSWDYVTESGKKTTMGEIRISESPNMSNPLILNGYMYCNVYNLKIGTTYYWNVTAEGVTSPVVSFRTADNAPRNLYIDGVTNVRDIGGYKTSSGKIIKQGLVYRTSRLNQSGLSYPNDEITADGKKEMTEHLGIKTEIDLRRSSDKENSGMTSSVLSGAKYFCIPVSTTYLLSSNPDLIIEFFRILSDRNNYPLLFHCHAGTDRTGMLAYTMGALLGVSEEDLTRDYLYSNFGNIGAARSLNLFQSLGFYKEISGASGNSLQEKAYNYLISIGVPAEYINSFKTIMLG